MKIKFLIGGLAALLASVAVASAFYVGYNPLTAQTGVTGVPVATGTMPAASGCSYTAEVGGSSVVQITAGATACTLTLTMPVGQNGSVNAAPTGVFCVFVDETHPADTISQASHTTTSCTSSAATVSIGDLILVEINEF